MNTKILRTFRNVISSIIIIITFVVSFFSIGGFVFNLVYISAPVSSYSMWPTINKTSPNAKTEWDSAYLNKYASFKNNDIVIAKVSWYENYIIKRLVASPGDTLEIKKENYNYSLYVNNEIVYKKNYTNIHGLNYKLEEYYQNYLTLLKSDTISTIEKSDGSKCIKLEEDQYFLLGDNWAESFDCIENGPVSKSNILGKVDFVIAGDSNKFWSIVKQILITTFSLNN